MMKRKKKSQFPLKPALLLGAAGVLLLASTVGSTRAALTYYNEEYFAQVSMSSIGVALLENDVEVSKRVYTDDGQWVDSGEGVLLESMLDEDQNEKLVPGKVYQEELSVANVGNIDTFVRVIVNRYWKNSEGKTITKDTELEPEWIELNLVNEEVWLYDDLSDDPDYSPEHMVLYYRDILPANMKTEPLSDTIRINPEIARDVTVSWRVEGNVTHYTYEYRYDGYSFYLDAEVNAVQTHNAVDAIRSAWGVDVTLSEDGTSITGVSH